MRSTSNNRPKPRRVRPAATRRGLRSPRIDIIIASPRWLAQRHAKALLRRVLTAAAASVPSGDGELSVVLTDDSGMRVLNRDWRRKDAATNVLSFPAAAVNAGRGAPRLLGDIVIAYETTEREARTARKRFPDHLAHLAVHGFLHLVGYDHSSNVEAAAMEGLETAILVGLDVPDPYLARAARGRIIPDG